MVPVDMEIFRRLASRKYSDAQRLLAIVAQGVFLGAVGPVALVYFSLFLDSLTGFGGFRGETAALIAGVVFAVEGFAFAAWTVATSTGSGGGRLPR